MRFSIIIPVYNVEKYLRQCIESVLNQDFQDFEVILVDDGSPDLCPAICDEYAGRNSRVRVIHQLNDGAANARNGGLAAARGEYILFLDSDDFWKDAGALGAIHRRLEESQADMLIFPYDKYYEEIGKHVRFPSVEAERARVKGAAAGSAIAYMIKTNLYKAAPWNKVVRHKIIQEHGLRFREGYLIDDIEWCGMLLLYARSFDLYESDFYCYRQRQGSAVHSTDLRIVTDRLFFCEKGYEQALALEDERMKYLLASYYAYEYAVLLGVSAGIKDRRLIGRIAALQDILEYDLCGKVQKVNGLRRMAGFPAACRILGIFMTLKELFKF